MAVSVSLFKDGEAYVADCPSLDISGYDTTEESAMEAFRYMLHDRLNEQLGNGTLRKDLVGHGWKVVRNEMKGDRQWKYCLDAR